MRILRSISWLFEKFRSVDNRGKSVDENEMASLFQAVACATDPSIDIKIAERRRMLVEAIAKLIHSDVWLWFSGVYDPENRGDSMVTQYVCGGFSNEKEQADFFRVIVHPDLTAIATAPIADALLSKQSAVAMRQDLISDDKWNAIPLSKVWGTVGFDDFIIAAFGVGPTTYSAVGFHRRVGSSRFTVREVGIARLVFSNVRWMHESIATVEASSNVLELSPRERQVVMFLINGDSRKEVARKLDLSEYTVSDHLKEIYRKFGVNSRAELLSKFIQ